MRHGILIGFGLLLLLTLSPGLAAQEATQGEKVGTVTHLLKFFEPLEPCLEETKECGGGGSGIGGGGSGGGTGGGGTTPTVLYRLTVDLYVIERKLVTNTLRDVRVKGTSRFERLIGSQWVKVDASFLGLACASTTGATDQDYENNAGFTDVKFWLGQGLAGTSQFVQCAHEARFGGVTYTGDTFLEAQYF